MDDHERRVWAEMLDQVAAYRAEAIDLGTLVRGLTGLMKASDLHDTGLEEEFWSRLAPLDMEDELRTEPWAPPGLASDDWLRAALDAFEAWVTDVLADPNGNRR